MAATRGTLTGGRRNGTTGTASRLGSEYVNARCSTWQTHADVTTWKGGRVVVTITDDDGMIVEVTVSAEDGPRSIDVYSPGHTPMTLERKER